MTIATDGRERERRRGGGREREGAAPSRPSGRGENAGGEERGAGDRDEVPVVVDERVDEPERERDRQRGRRVALRPLEPPDGADGRRGGGRDEREQERQPDEPGPGEELERDAVRLRHRRRQVAVALARDLERVRAGARERVGLEDVPRLAPPGEPVVRAQAREPARVVPHLLAPELVRDPAGVGNEADDGHERHGEGEPAQEARPTADAPSRSERAPCELAGAGGDERGARDQEQAEPGAVGDAIGVRGCRPRRARAG